MEKKRLLKDAVLTILIVCAVTAIFPPIVVMASITGVACVLMRNF